ncbi:hypothetical protein PC116_g22204 [Phytophthora cactorum]|uniref:Uncharacterized protein n=2 Tax=Phytophthora cactorum TaxID=29920 RepID=A0A329RE52_9STRA|nr:hypothetical protein PC114_g25925 [Phytophthora cactorum]KAG2913276.1 hypothetical protein PC117_g18610 [Phytophthora cactorum]KAG3049986.1 hypothetical protein PC122_g23378 [Phytophthora cactorum]KAG4229464.1 hypothetical protein PC116_g22204 [Phytophthora cactorum]RAW21722.1 hypothetical protein PC110_g21835 [Phytophthora cactorum]
MRRRTTASVGGVFRRRAAGSGSASEARYVSLTPIVVVLMGPVQGEVEGTLVDMIYDLRISKEKLTLEWVAAQADSFPRKQIGRGGGGQSGPHYGVGSLGGFFHATQQPKSSSPN